jgi:hypothetical protein
MARKCRARAGADEMKSVCCRLGQFLILLSESIGSSRRIWTWLLICSAANPALGNAADLGYSSVAEARRSVANLPGVNSKSLDGWYIVEDPIRKVSWTFPNIDKIGYPSVIRRRVVEDKGKVSIETTILCEAEEIDCKQLVQSFAALDRKLQNQAKSGP